MATWNQAAKARNDFADMIDGLSEEQLNGQTLCAEWDAVGVLGHLTGFTTATALGFIGGMLKAGFNFEKMSLKMSSAETEGKTVPEVVGVLRTNAAKSAPMPMFPEEMTVADIAVHTLDVARPLGLAGVLDSEVLKTSLDFITTNKKNKILIDDLLSLDGVKLEATDVDWTFGSGKTISGSGESLLLALARRDSARSDLSGDGLSVWN